MWIETSNHDSFAQPGKVAPSRACGLKHLWCLGPTNYKQVAPSRACGLKPKIDSGDLNEAGRAFTGVWIETRSLWPAKISICCRAFTGVWIETRFVMLPSSPSSRRAFTGVWIETTYVDHSLAHLAGRAFTGVWIETPTPCLVMSFARSRLHGRVD